MVDPRKGVAQRRMRIALSAVMVASLVPSTALADQGASSLRSVLSAYGGAPTQEAVAHVGELSDADATTYAKGTSQGDAAQESGEEALDFDALADGIYTVHVDMVNVNREQPSMADSAIDHDVTLEVIGGEYYLTFDFQGLWFLGQFGYLATLRYYDEGYTYTNVGLPSGALVDAEVLSHQKDDEGADVYDMFNDPASEYRIYEGLYPDLLRVKYVQTARDDKEGYVPLQVFVPVMESIGEGTGTQNVLAQVDKASVKLVSAAVSVDTSALSVAVTSAESVLAKGGKSEEATRALQGEIEKARAVLEGEDVTQEAIEAAVCALEAAVSAYEAAPDEVAEVNRGSLAQALADAKNIAQGSKTDSAWSELQTAILSAEAVHDAAAATQAQIDAAQASLSQAVDAFKASADKPAETLDFNNLEDGVYSLTIDMYKMNRSDKSMSNNAINHKAKLEVIDGVYYLTFDFKGLNVGTSLGYLGSLSYYDAGYAYSGQSVAGTTVPGEVLSYQTDEAGANIVDDYTQYNNGNPYPNQVRITYVQTARNDAEGWIPLQVFVPIMESIGLMGGNSGMGLQDVLAKADFSSLARATDDDFVDDGSTGEADDPGAGAGGGTTPVTTVAGPTKVTATTPSATTKSAAPAGTSSTAKATTLSKTGDNTTSAAVTGVVALGSAVVAAWAAMRRRLGMRAHEE